MELVVEAETSEHLESIALVDQELLSLRRVIHLLGVLVISIS